MTPEVMLVLLQELPRQSKVKGAYMYEGAAEANCDMLMLEISDLVRKWPERHRAIVGGILSGWKKCELAAHLGVSRRQVQRVAKKLREAVRHDR